MQNKNPKTMSRVIMKLSYKVFVNDDNLTGKSYVLIIMCLYVTLFISRTASLDATLGIYTEDAEREKVEIPEDSVFVGTDDGTPSEMWCRGSESWDICTWLWNDKTNHHCQYIDKTPVNDCTNEFMSIDKEGDVCNLKLYQGLSKLNHEGSWECRLSKLILLTIF